MENFEHYTPTHIYFGKDEENKTGEIIKNLGYKKVLLHFGSKSAKESGLLGRVEKSLLKNGIEYISLGGVLPNPRLSKIKEGIKLAKENEVDLILAIGGGSVIDSAKAIGYGALYQNDVWDFYSNKEKPKNCLPIGVILTHAATGSEMSDSSVITNEEGLLKRGCNSNCSRPIFAILNPELTYTLSEFQSVCGFIDIIMHTLERYFGPNDRLELTDSIAEQIIKTVIKNSRILINDPKNYKARAEIMWAGSLSHNDLSGYRILGDWSCHQLEHELSGEYDIAHGVGLSAIWASWARYVYKEDPKRFERLGEKVFGIKEETPEIAAIKTIEKFENFFNSIKAPVSIIETGINLDEDQIQKLANKCSFNGKRSIGRFKSLNEIDMATIYKNALFPDKEL